MNACVYNCPNISRKGSPSQAWLESKPRKTPGDVPFGLELCEKIKKSPLKIIRYSVQLHESIPMHTCKGSFATLYLAPNHQMRESESFGWRGWKCKDFHPFLRQMLSCPLQVQSVSISILIRFQEHLGPILVFFLVWKLKRMFQLTFPTYISRKTASCKLCLSCVTCLPLACSSWLSCTLYSQAKSAQKWLSDNLQIYSVQALKDLTSMVTKHF